jgi:ketosteroid isomerase-like protein
MTRALLLTLPLAALLIPASAQPRAPHPDVRVVDCDPAGPATPPRGAVCAAEPRPEGPSAERAHDPATAAVARLYAALALDDVDAVVAALDDHVMWTGPDGRAVGRSAVAARLAALHARGAADGAAPTGTLRLAAPGRVVATSRGADGRPARVVWHVADGRVTGVEHAVGLPGSHAADL